jgi:hypothetical protein
VLVRTGNSLLFNNEPKHVGRTRMYEMRALQLKQQRKGQRLEQWKNSCASKKNGLRASSLLSNEERKSSGEGKKKSGDGEKKLGSRQ